MELTPEVILERIKEIESKIAVDCVKIGTAESYECLLNIQSKLIDLLEFKYHEKAIMAELKDWAVRKKEMIDSEGVEIIENGDNKRTTE